VNGNNFVKTMLRLAEIKDEITVVSDQIGSPTYTYDLSRAIIELIKTDKYGIHHITNDDVCSWNDFAKEIFRQSAKRPLNSRLEKNFIKLRTWNEALSHFLKENNNDK
jgi:dTDP-4-dehydrorhamnose reductase